MTLEVCKNKGFMHGSLAFLMQISNFGILDYNSASGKCEVWVHGEVIAVMCFGFLTNLFTEFTVHACNMFTHLKLI